MSVWRLVFNIIAVLAVLVVALYQLAAGRAEVWTFMLVGLVALVNLSWLIWLWRNPRPQPGGTASGWLSWGGFSLSKVRMAVAIVAGLILAIPSINMLGAMVMFPLLFYILIAAVANFAPIAILAGRGLQALGLRFDLSPLVEAWVYCGIMWVGCAYGVARWGDAGASIGGKNMPYLEMLFAPYMVLYQWGLRHWLG